MRIVHMADSHLGFSSFSRVDQRGMNLVEEMVYQGFSQTIDLILDLKPDAVVHSGDVFHHVRPRILPLYQFKRGLERLSQAGIPVVVISGNHDAPKSYAYKSPFCMYEGVPGVHIAHDYSYQCFELDDTYFHCIPFCIDKEDYMEEFSRLQLKGNDVLVMHGLLESMEKWRMMTVGEHKLSDSFLKSDFNYIALGHIHAQTQVSGNAWYSGSVEYFNFGEAGERKGILLVDLERGEVSPLDVRPHYMVDHEPVECSSLSSMEVLEEIEARCQDITGKIVRITLKDVDREVYRRIDPKRLSRIASRAIYLKVRPLYADENAPMSTSRMDRLDLPTEFREFVCREGDGVPSHLRSDVTDYGAGILKEILESRNSEDLHASEPSCSP